MDLAGTSTATAASCLAGVLGDAQVDVLKGWPDHAQTFEFHAVPDRPPGQFEQHAGGLVGMHDDLVAMPFRLIPRACRKHLAMQRCRQPESDHCPGDVT